MTIQEKLSLAVRQVQKFDTSIDLEFSEQDKVLLSVLIDKIIETFGHDTPWLSMLEQAVSFFRKQREVLVTETIPTIMGELGFPKLTLEDGTPLKIEKVYSLSTQNKEMLTQWLIDHEMADLLKETLEFGKGELTEETVNELSDRGLSFSRKSDVNANTLKAAIKRHVEDGGDLPPQEALIVSIFDRVKIG